MTVGGPFKWYCHYIMLFMHLETRSLQLCVVPVFDSTHFNVRYYEAVERNCKESFFSFDHGAEQ
jgi:hypothetical protein